MDNSHFTALSGSERQLLPSSTPVGDPPADELMKVTVYARQDPSATTTLPDLEDYTPGRERPALTVEEANSVFSAARADLDKIASYYGAQGLRVLETSPEKRSVLLQGTVRAMSQAFHVPLKLYDSAHGRYRGRLGPVYVPRELSGIVEAVFGLDNRHVGRAFRRRARSMPARALAERGFLPPQLAELYAFPPAIGRRGQTIGILTFNGELQHGSGGFDGAVVRRYFGDVLGANGPQIDSVTVHGPGNDPGDGSNDLDSTGEVLLDLEMVGALAPEASIVMYFTVFTEQGWVDAITAAVTDAQRMPSVVSISYGNPEDEGTGTRWTKAAILKVDEAFRRAAAANITICVASGDDGSRDQVTADTLAHVDFPASSPWVLSVGGTHLEADQHAITRETVWHNRSGAGGGGVSNVFALPPYQRPANVPPSVNPGRRIGRGVPDVAAVADPQTGVRVSTPQGHTEMIGGTSASAPLWAALIARLNELAHTRLGFVNPLLYSRGSGSLHDIVEGDNGAYRAGPGWDACTGLGSPDGAALLAALTASATRTNGTAEVASAAR